MTKLCGGNVENIEWSKDVHEQKDEIFMFKVWIYCMEKQSVYVVFHDIYFQSIKKSASHHLFE